jgi:hypothetical protein
MNWWVVLLVAGNVVGSIGPLPQDMDAVECNRRIAILAPELRAESLKQFPDKPPVTPKCLQAAARPVMDTKIE